MTMPSDRPDIPRLLRRVRAVEEKQSDHANAIADLSSQYGRALGTISDMHGQLERLEAGAERLERDMRGLRDDVHDLMRPSRAVSVAAPASAPGGGAMNQKVMLALIAVISTMGTGIVELIKVLVGH